MKLTIKNLGPLTKGGSIDLDKRFYVFVGKNNSGKTYVANLMSRLFDGQERQKLSIPEEFLIFNNDSKTTEITNKWYIDAVQKLFSEWLQSQVPLIFNTKTDLFKDLILSLKFNNEDFKNNFLEKEISFVFYFPFSNSTLIEDDLMPDSYYCLKTKKNKFENIFYLEETELSVSEFNNIFKEHLVITNGAKTTKVFTDKTSAYQLARQLFTNWLINLLIPKNNKLFGPNPIFLPANRAFLTSFWKYIYRVQKTIYDEMTELRNQGIENIDNFLKTPYTDATNDLIKAIERLDSKNSIREKYSDLTTELENIIGGKIVLKKGAEGGLGRMDIQFQIGNENKELSLDMYLASSSVNQLTILYLYLKYWAQDSHNFLIIDEPEENLHPENQVKLVNLLMKFTDRNNNKVLITTHSSLVTETVNNYIRIGFLKKNNVNISELLEGHSPAPLKELEDKDFGVYYFGEGSFKEYSSDEFGVFFKDFAKVEDEVRNIANLLKDKVYKISHSKIKK